MPVRRHRTGNEMPQMVHPDPDPNALALCWDLTAHPDTESVILFGSRATGGWDEQSDLDMIIIHPAPVDDEGQREVYGSWMRLKNATTRAIGITPVPTQEVSSGHMAASPEDYRPRRRTLKDVKARASGW